MVRTESVISRNILGCQVVGGDTTVRKLQLDVCSLEEFLGILRDIVLFLRCLGDRVLILR